MLHTNAGEQRKYFRIDECIEEDGPKYDIMEGDNCHGSFITKKEAYAQLGRIIEQGTFATVNRNREKIEDRIKEIKKDERLTYAPATVFSNAPLALTQLQLATELNALEWALALPLSKMPLPKTKEVSHE